MSETENESLTPEEHYIQAGAMLRVVEAELPKLLVNDDGLDYYQITEWSEKMTAAAAVHAQLATAYPLRSAPGIESWTLDRFVSDLDTVGLDEDDRP